MGQKTWGSLHKEYLFAEVMKIYCSVCVEIIGVRTLMTELINLSFANKTMDLISLTDLYIPVMHGCWRQDSRVYSYVLLNCDIMQGTKILGPSSGTTLLVCLYFWRKEITYHSIHPTPAVLAKCEWHALGWTMQLRYTKQVVLAQDIDLVLSQDREVQNT